MEQQHFKVSLSLGTKLLVSVMLLLFTSIIFLDVSAINLLTDDKRAYTFQAQSTEALLMGREFVNTAKYSLDTLRLAHGSMNPMEPVGHRESAAFQSVLDNQSAMASMAVHLLDDKTGLLSKVNQAYRPDAVKEAGLELEDVAVAPDALKTKAPELLKNSFVFLNLSKVGKPPLLGIALADLKFKDNPKGMPVAIGYLQLKDFGQDSKASSMTISSRDGWVLFDTDPARVYAKSNMSDDPLYDAALQSKVASGTQEFVFQDTRYLGSYVRPGLDLVVLTRTEWRKAMSAAYTMTEKFVLLGCMTIAAAIIFAILFSKTITAPVNRLYEATKEVAAGNFNVTLKQSGSDEIGALTSSFLSMSRKISDLIVESMRKVQLENELAIASTVQQTLIPKAVQDTEKALIHSHYQSAAECGGDWWGYFGVPGKMCFMIADATGHGLPSALITAAARAAISVINKLAQEDPRFIASPSHMLSYANRAIYEASGAQIMMTFFAGIVDFERGVITYASAGHNPPWLFKKGQDGSFTLKSLTATGQRLGEAMDVPPYEEKAIDIAKGDVLFLYTDGLMEGKNPAGDMYGKKKVKNLLESTIAQGPETAMKKLVKEFLAHNESKPLDDDLTLVFAEMK